MPIYGLRCTAAGCGRKFEVLMINGRATAMDHPDENNLFCPDCGGEGEGLVGVSLLKDLGGEAGVGREFPRFDHGLGTMVRDAAHHRWLLKHHPDGTPREVPLRPTEGEVDFEEGADIEQRATEQVTREYQEYVRELREGPNREAYGKLVERLASEGTAMWDRRP